VIQADATRVRLTPLNPFFASRSDYAVRRGSLSFDARVELDQVGGYEADVGVRRHDLRLDSKPGEFEHDFGVSLELGMALMRDLRGDIVLSVPIAGDAEGTRVSVFAVVRRALHRAILNALTSPLKIVGAVVRRDGEMARVAPSPIVFETGTLQPTAAGIDQLRDLANVLAAKPQLVAVLRPVRREEGEALAAIEATGDGAGTEDSAAGDEDEDDGGFLTRWFGDDEEDHEPATPDVAAPAPGAPGDVAVAESIARERMQIVAQRLRDEFGVPSERVMTQPDPVSARSGPPRVDVELAPRQ
jgi:hypothetical protein